MSKKIIAVIAVVTIVFVSVFAACTKNEEEGIYIDKNDLDLVTDENGEKVLGEDGELIVFATDEDGDRIEKENGEYETLAQQFQPIEDDGVIEDYGFKFTIPDGWKTTNDFGKFENTKKTQIAEIDIINTTFKEYYKQNKDFYEKLKAEGIEVTWEDDVKLGEGFNNACRFTMKSDEGIAVMYFFENTDNIYKVLFNAEDASTAIDDSEALCKQIEFKPYTYY